MKARHPSARTGGTRYFCHFSASRGPVALRSWGEFGRATFPSRGHLVWCHHCQGPAVARGSRQSCLINRWLTQPNRAITRHPNLAIVGRHLVALGLRQCSHFAPCPHCSNCSFSGWLQRFPKTDSAGTTRCRSNHRRPAIAICSAPSSTVAYACPIGG
jgi:hypothetical protein